MRKLYILALRTILYTWLKKTENVNILLRLDTPHILNMFSKKGLNKEKFKSIQSAKDKNSNLKH